MPLPNIIRQRRGYMIKRQTENLFLQVAGITIKFSFTPTEQEITKELLIENIRRVWGHSGFLLKRAVKFDYEIEFVFDPAKQDYSLSFVKNVSSKKTVVYYYAGIPALQYLLKTLIPNIIGRAGFLLHCSGCMDKKGNLFIFSAPTGGGKTTISNLIMSGKISKFSDDTVIVRKISDSWKFFSPPFFEKSFYPIKREASKAKIFFVKKAKSPKKVHLKNKAEILRLLLKNVWLKDGKIDKDTLTLITDFASSQNFYILYSSLNAARMTETIYGD